MAGGLRGGAGRRRPSPPALVAAVAVAVGLLAAPIASAQTPPPEPPPTTPAPTTTPEGSTPTTVTPGSTVAGPTTSIVPPAQPTPGGFGGPPPVDPTAPPEPPMADPSPQVRVLLSQLRAQAHEIHVAAAGQALADQLAVEGRARDALAKAQADLRAAEDVVRVDRERLRAYAVYAYVDPGSTALEQVLDDEPADSRRRDVLLDVSIERAQEVLRADEGTVRRRQRDVADRQGDLRSEVQRTGERTAERDRMSADQADLDSNVRKAVSAQYGGSDWELPILGENVFAPDELAAWFDQHGVRSRAQAPVADLALWYLAEGSDEGVRGDMAFAQSVLETGSFTNDDTIRFNNFAGVGHCDTCPTGFAFATPQLGVRAQIQLLKEYAIARPELAHPLVDRRLHGPAGCCETWTDLTHIWATNGNYGPKIMNVYRDMLRWLVVRRGLTPLDVGP